MIATPTRSKPDRGPELPRIRYLFLGVPVSVVVLIAINTGIELSLTAADFGLLYPGGLRARVYELGAFWARFLYGSKPEFSGQTVSMFLTYAFLHGGLLHLVVNMLALFTLGKTIVLRIGQKKFVVAYLICVLGGAIGYGLFTRSASPMVGASGALFGLLGIWICWDYMDRRHFGYSLWVTGRALVFLIVYNLVFWVLLSGQLAWETHLGGFIAGWLLALHWGRSAHLQSRERRMLAKNSASKRR